jgi:hypothetical protein
VYASASHLIRGSEEADAGFRDLERETGSEEGVKVGRGIVVRNQACEALASGVTKINKANGMGKPSRPEVLVS